MFLLTGVDQDLASDPIEVVAASDDVEPAVVPPDVAADDDVAEAADLTIEMRDRVALQLAAMPLLAVSAVADRPGYGRFGFQRACP